MQTQSLHRICMAHNNHNIMVIAMTQSSIYPYQERITSEDLLYTI